MALLICLPLKRKYRYLKLKKGNFEKREKTYWFSNPGLRFSKSISRFPPHLGQHLVTLVFNGYGPE